MKVGNGSMGDIEYSSLLVVAGIHGKDDASDSELGKNSIKIESMGIHIQKNDKSNLSSRSFEPLSSRTL